MCAVCDVKHYHCLAVRIDLGKASSALTSISNALTYSHSSTKAGRKVYVYVALGSLALALVSFRNYFEN